MKRLAAIAGLVCLLLSTACLGGSVWVGQTAAARVPTAVLLTCGDKPGVGFTKAAAGKAEACFAVADFSATLQADGRALRAAAVQPGFAGASGYRLAQGQDLSPGAPQALIDEQLARALFDGQAVGREVALNGAAYRVAGVLAGPANVLEQRAAGAVPTVLVNTPPGGKDLPLTRVLVVQTGDVRLLPAEALERVQEGYGVALAAKPHSLADGALLLREVPLLALPLLLALPFVLLCAWVVRALLRQYAARGEGLLRRLCRLGVAVAAFALAMYLFSLLLGQVQLPGQYLPADHLFSLSHYQAELAAFRASLAGAAGASLPFRLLAVAGKGAVLCALAATALCWAGSLLLAGRFFPRRQKRDGQSAQG